MNRTRRLLPIHAPLLAFALVCPGGAHAAESAPAAYVAPMSHLDLTFMGSVEECLSRGAKVFSGALRLLDSQPEFRFLVEYPLFLDVYRSLQPVQAARLDALIRAGRVALGAQWSGIYVTQEDEEDIIRNILIAQAGARARHGIELDTLQLTDLPGVTPQLPQLCAGLGIRNLVLTRCAPPDTLFWFEAPGGTRVLTWSSDGYNQAGACGLGAAPGAVRADKLGERLAQHAGGGIPPLLYYGSDQWLPPSRLAPNVAAWNRDAPLDRRLAISTPEGYFRAVRASGAADKAPVLRGELPSVWPYLEPAHAHVSRWDADPTRALDAAERFSTLAWRHLGLEYPRAELDALWRSLLLARDHNYGGKGAGAGHPRKYAERRAVLHRARVLLTRALAALGEQVEAPRDSVPIVVFNPLNWERTEPVRAHVTFYPGEDPATRDVLPRNASLALRDPNGASVPFQITEDRRDTLGEFDLVFVARAVPGLGYATYTLGAARPGEPHAIADPPPKDPNRAKLWFEADPPPPDAAGPKASAPAPVPASKPVLETSAVRLTIDPKTGGGQIFALERAAVGARAAPPIPVVDALRIEARHELPEVCRRPPLGLSLDAPEREQVEAFVPAPGAPVRVETDGPVLTRAVVRGSILGMPAELRYTICRGLPWIELETWIDWDLRRFGRVELCWCTPLARAAASYGLPFGSGAFGPEHLMPGSGVGRGDEAARATWEQTREISRWLDVNDERRGVTMATTHRCTRVEPGADGRLAVRCCLVRGGRIRNPEPDANGADPRVRLGFRFRFQPHAGSWRNARAPRIGWEATQPLFAYTVNDTWSPKSLPPRQALARVVPVSGSGDPLLTCLKQGEDGAGVVARWYESTGADAQVDFAIGPVPTRNARVDLREKLVPDESWTKPTTRDRQSTRAWEIVTVRAK